MFKFNEKNTKTKAFIIETSQLIYTENQWNDIYIIWKRHCGVFIVRYPLVSNI